MQLRIERHTLMIIPETDQDVAFIEDTMGLSEDGDVIKLERIDDETTNWVKFKLESFPQAEKITDEDPVTPSRTIQINSAKYKPWSHDSTSDAKITLTDSQEMS